MEIPYESRLLVGLAVVLFGLVVIWHGDSFKASLWVELVVCELSAVNMLWFAW